MDRCNACGGSLTPDLGWCARCYAPVLRAVADVDEPAVSDREPYPDDLTIVRPIRRMPLPETRDRPKHSYGRRRATTLGPASKIAITIVLLALGLALLPVVSRWADAAGQAGIGFVMLYAGVYVVATLLLLSQLWKRGRVR